MKARLVGSASYANSWKLLKLTKLEIYQLSTSPFLSGIEFQPDTCPAAFPGNKFS
jgi:hypothetical protein